MTYYIFKITVIYIGSYEKTLSCVIFNIYNAILKETRQ